MTSNHSAKPRVTKSGTLAAQLRAPFSFQAKFIENFTSQFLHSLLNILTFKYNIPKNQHRLFT